MKPTTAMLWLVALLCVFSGLPPLHAQDTPAPAFVLYVPFAIAESDIGGQNDAVCPHLPEGLRYHYTPANDETGGFHRHSFLVDYNIPDPAYMYVAAEYQLARDDALSDLVLSGVTADDGLPSGALRFGEYSRAPQLQNGVTYHWRVRLLCTDLAGDVQSAAWTQVETVVAGG